MPNLLVLEDDPAILEVFQLLLEEEGFHVLPASSMAEAEGRLQEDFHAAVLDLGVAGLDIENFTRQIRSRPSSPPVLLCSASPRLGAVASQLHCAALAKPFEIYDFIDAVWQLFREQDTPGH